jgi:hypothetical protein
MRKFLLASATTVGILGTAAAQPAPPPPANLPIGVTSVPSQPVPFLGGNNPFNSNGARIGARNYPTNIPEAGQLTPPAKRP